MRIVTPLGIHNSCQCCELLCGSMTYKWSDGWWVCGAGFRKGRDRHSIIENKTLWTHHFYNLQSTSNKILNIILHSTVHKQSMAWAHCFTQKKFKIKQNVIPSLCPCSFENSKIWQIIISLLFSSILCNPSVSTKALMLWVGKRMSIGNKGEAARLL